MTALLLDVGGVVIRSGSEMLELLGRREPAVRAVAARRGPLGPEPDPDWDRMLRGELSEREYWALRAAEVGRALGRAGWPVSEFMAELFERPGVDVVRPAAAALVADVRAAGLPLGVLTNDLAAFHGDGPLRAGLAFLDDVDVLIDGSWSGVLKPDPRSYAAAVDALGVPAGEIVFVDDMPANIEGARRAGLRTVQLDLRDPDAAFARARSCLGLVPAR
ncbi:HAD-IA family hydrolase [Pseudonocardia benzenivorans]|jgi:putative hydrolase of the HAD superfamily|uniref:HAD-superfamily hydrolase, subfamily IA, variant 3 n=2 Tax=Pseudonocardia TaxID=1847 RepID=F4CY94_PSEUX|nr:HAD-IA family hydrolase [Pseudonocardia dioxanivorans]AEA24716.1 HAD-superfamily hydrolase, subfamily IA, variant 3 [Pseudonocardia dioxanivorans CB1190]GJF01236.1 haloacid dehalogenase [Pseudonocardia sp. D17]